MRSFIIGFLCFFISCSPRLLKQGYGKYNYNDKECSAEIELLINGKFSYNHNCLGVSKSISGGWKISGRDTIILNINPEVSLEKILSSNYMNEFPNFAILCGKSNLKLGKMNFKRNK